MDAQDGLAALDVRTTNDYAAVEPPRAQQRGIEHVRAIRRRHENHAFVRFEAVHLDQQLVQRLFALIMPAAEASAAMAAHSVDFIDEDDARRVLLALLEEIADAARAYPHEHLNEIRSGDRKE